MPQDPRAEAACPLRWRDVYSEAELYKAAVRLYTKPVFQWRKALSTENARSGPTARERQVLAFHKNYKSTSPLYERIRAKYPYW